MSHSLDPTFIQGSKGQIFNLHFVPTNQIVSPVCLIIAPAFEEEMNRCRYMCNLLAQRVTPHGVGVMYSDPYGTGDSEGDFKDADWQQMVSDLLSTVEYAQSQGYQKVILLGIRLGALQVLEALPKIDSAVKVLFWQPVINGKVALTQLLRIKIAASLGREEKAGSIKEFEESSQSGEVVEVSGYQISPALFSGIQNAKLDDGMESLDVPVSWFTTIASAERKPPRAELGVISNWQEKGKSINYQVVVDPPYWQVHERTLAHNLVEATGKDIVEFVNEL